MENCDYTDFGPARFSDDVDFWDVATHTIDKGEKGDPDYIGVDITGCIPRINGLCVGRTIVPSVLPSNRFIYIESIEFVGSVTSGYTHEAVRSLLKETLVPGTTYILRLSLNALSQVTIQNEVNVENHLRIHFTPTRNKEVGITEPGPSDSSR